MSKKTQILLVTIITVLIIASLILLYFLWPSLKDASLIEEDLCISDNCVLRVLDGDTIQMRTGEIVRLICINTPERTDTGYFEATKFLKDLIEGKPVRLEKDVSETDKYNRLLRYVYVNDSSGKEIFVNKELYKRGYADIMRYPPDVKRCDEIKN
jgi:micrococcal nuclease